MSSYIVFHDNDFLEVKPVNVDDVVHFNFVRRTESNFVAGCNPNHIVKVLENGLTLLTGCVFKDEITTLTKPALAKDVASNGRVAYDHFYKTVVQGGALKADYTVLSLLKVLEDKSAKVAELQRLSTQFTGVLGVVLAEEIENNLVTINKLRTKILEYVK